jgi:hypothetical protein
MYLCVSLSPIQRVTVLPWFDLRLQIYDGMKVYLYKCSTFRKYSVHYMKYSTLCYKTGVVLLDLAPLMKVF